MLRNLLYNCWAPDWSDDWRLNIESLCEHAGAFNGRKIVILKTGPNTIDPSVVKQQFESLGEIEFIEVPNNPELGEVAGFMDGLGCLASMNPDEVTFYAHTKGVSYPSSTSRNPYNGRAAKIEVIREWRDVMYRECLQDIGRIERVLQKYATCGCFLVPFRPPWGGWARWQYSGTFWWVNHAKLFSIPGGHNVHQGYYGVESYLGLHLPVSEAYCLYGTVRELDDMVVRMTGQADYTPAAYADFPGLLPTQRLT